MEETLSARCQRHFTLNGTLVSLGYKSCSGGGGGGDYALCAEGLLEALSHTCDVHRTDGTFHLSGFKYLQADIGTKQSQNKPKKWGRSKGLREKPVESSLGESFSDEIAATCCSVKWRRVFLHWLWWNLSAQNQTLILRLICLFESFQN